jgi:predicted HTH transcriptional regulator
MREAGYVEKLGSGFIAIFESYEKRNLEDPVVIEGENYIKCILPRVEKMIKAHDEESLIMALFNIYPEITLDLVQSELSTSRSTAARKINVLIKKGLLIRIGKTRAIRYRRLEPKK